MIKQFEAENYHEFPDETDAKIGLPIGFFSPVNVRTTFIEMRTNTDEIETFGCILNVLEIDYFQIVTCKIAVCSVIELKQTKLRLVSPLYYWLCGYAYVSDRESTADWWLACILHKITIYSGFRLARPQQVLVCQCKRFIGITLSEIDISSMKPQHRTAKITPPTVRLGHDGTCYFYHSSTHRNCFRNI